jgi:hypothetical protein
MANIGNALLCAAAMTALWTLIGLPIAMRVPAGAPSWLWAPALGWAIHSVVSLPLFWVIGMSRPAVLAATAAFVAVALAGLWMQRPAISPTRPSALLIAALLGAALLALGPMAAIIPKPTAEGVTLAPAIFDHAKIALIDEMIRSGVPARNPVFGEAGAPARASYYYLWHFSAAVAAVITGVSGWEADAGLTWFTAFASLLLMIALAIRLGGQTSAAIVVVVLAATASVRSILGWLAPDVARSLIGWASGFGGWLFQTSWAPQHVASAMCVVLACVLLSQLPYQRGWLLPVVLGLVAAAGFESSAWVGGITFALAAAAIGLQCLWSLPREARASFLLRSAAAAALTIVLATPLLYDQVTTAALRGGGSPIAITPVSVLGGAFSETARRILDLPAYWLVYLPVEFPAFYPAGLIGLYLLLKERRPDQDQAVHALALLLATSLVTGWLLVSVISDNNDLGWRAVLPAVMLLVAFAAAAIARWLSAGAFSGKVEAGFPQKMRPGKDSKARIPVALTLVGILLGLPEGVVILRENVLGVRRPSERIFATTPEMWDAVRRHTAVTERLANNPVFMRDMTSWPINISWALLADRRSCYAGRELAIPFTPISAARRTEIEAQFVRVFAGEPAAADVRQLAERFGCDVVVVTAQDGAWLRDPFASTDAYRLVEERPGAWRIYRRAADGRP